MNVEIRLKLELMFKVHVKLHVQGNAQVQVNFKTKAIVQVQAFCPVNCSG